MQSYDNNATPSSLASPLTLFERGFAGLVLLISFVSALRMSHKKLFWSDEVLEYYADHKASIVTIIRDQRLHPWMLDPPLWHILDHLMLRLLPTHPELAMRLPSLLALPVAEWYLFRFARRVSGQGAVGLLAMCLVFASSISGYAAEARPYMLITACLAMAMNCYSLFLEREASAAPPHSPALPLVGMAMALGGAIALHYFSLFLLLPFVVAEAARLWFRRRVDWRAAAALFAAALVFCLNLPFLGALHEVRAHYYLDDSTRPKMVLNTYLWMVMHGQAYYLVPGRREHVLYALTVLVVVLVFCLVCVRGWSYWRLQTQRPALLLGLGISLLPFFYVLLAQITHAYSLRYSLPSALGAAVMVALVFRTAVADHRWQALLAGIVLLWGGLTLRAEANSWGDYKAWTLHSLETNALAQAALSAQPDHHLYTQAVAQFVVAEFYGPPLLRSSLVAIREEEREIHWRHRVPSSVFARNLELTTSLPIITYQEFQQRPGQHLLLVFHDAAEEWIDREIDTGLLPAGLVGPAFGGQLYRTAGAAPSSTP